MPDLAPTIDGMFFALAQSSFANARDATSAPGGVSTTSTRYSAATRYSRTSGRGGGTIHGITRAIFEFDTSGISATPSDATLKLFGFLGSSADFFVVKGNTATDGALAASDYEPLGWTTGADNSSNVTKYSSEETSWLGNGYNQITLTAAALADMRDDNVIKLMLIESVHDLPNNEPGSNITANTGMYFQDYTGTSRDPILSYTAGSAGYGNSVMGVASGNIGSINGVATANIEKVNGV
tara:strand:+ start:187 stop:903 length:717 start_codon:yes stop_codon:yes gene_type:complete